MDKAVENNGFHAYYQQMEDLSALFSHSHNCHEMILVESGEAEFHIENRDYVVTRHSLIVIGHLERHRVTIRQAPYARYVLLIPNDFCMNEMRLPQLASLFLYRPSMFSHLQRLEEPLFNHLRDFFRAIIDEYQGDQPFKAQQIGMLLEMMLIQLYRNRPECFAWENNADMAMVFQIQRYIAQHYREALTLDAMARLFLTSKYRISRCFSRITSYGFSQYISVCRLNEAKRLLQSTDLPVTRVAEWCGYGDVNHFIRAFRQREGLPPLQFRKHSS